MRKIDEIFAIIIIFLSVLSFVACNKNPIDFSNLHGIEASGEWGFPLLNDKITINRILEKMDSIEYLSIGDDRSMSFIYEITSDSVIQASDFLNIDHQHFEGSDVIPGITPPPFPDTVNLNFPSEIVCHLNADLFRFKSAQIKSGTIKFNYTPNCSLPLSVKFSTNQIKSPTGVPLTVQISNHNNNNNIDLTGYSITPGVDNTIFFTGELKLYSDGTPIDDISYTFQIDLEDIRFTNIVSQFAVYEIPFDEELNFELNLSNVTGDIAINNPKLSVYTRNSFNITGMYCLDTAQFSTPDGSCSSLISQPLQIFFPISPNQYTGSVVQEISSIYYNTRFNKFKTNGKLVLNPEGFDSGDLVIDESSSIGIKINAEIPFNISISNCIYRDTFDNALLDIVNTNQIDMVEKLTVRLAFINGLPLDLIPQVCFYNSITGTKDSLLLHNAAIHGGYDDIPCVCQPIIIEIPAAKAKRIIQSDKMILTFRLNTQNNSVQFKTNQFIDAKIGAKIQYAT